jgi:hypothetical protein
MKSHQEILQFYDTELQQYANRVVAPFGQYIEKNLAPYRPFLKYLFDYYLFLSYCSDKGMIPAEAKYSPIRVIFAKCCLSYYGVFISLQNGLPTEAVISLRSLLEAFINIKVILEKDTDERLKLFRNFQFVEKWFNIQANLKLVSNNVISQVDFDKAFDPKFVSEMDIEYHKIKADYHPVRPHHWAWKIFSDGNPNANNPSIRILAKHVGLELDFVKVYSSTSLSVHGSHNLINTLAEGGSISIAPKFTNMIYTDGCLAIDYMSHVFQMIVRYFKFDNPDELDFYINHFVLAALREAEKGAP